MLRRIEGALEQARGLADPVFLVSGGAPRAGISEAAAMRDLLVAAGIEPADVLTDAESADTLQSVLNCRHILQRGDDVRAVILCTDTYHLPCCRWLFRLAGQPTLVGAVRSGRPAVGLLAWSYWWLREAIALPYDTVALLWRMRLGERHAGGV